MNFGDPLGPPWEPQNHQKSQKDEIQKSVKTQNDFKEPPRADLKGLGMARSIKNHQNTFQNEPRE